jgi:Flp pilus assembly protein TadG
MRFLREENGQTLFLTAICMTVLLGFMALALDVGTLFRAKRRMQIAADSAAMAATTELFYNGSTNATTKAYAAAKANGVDNTVAGNTVAVTLPPVSVGGTSCATCVEVQVSTPNPTVFMGMFAHSTVNVGAMAVGGAPAASNTCVYVMDPGADDALDIHGAGRITAPGCSVYVNSSQPDALCVTGSAGKSDLANISVVGQQGSSGPCKGDPGVPVNLNAGVLSNPWSDLPDPSASCNAGNTTNLASATLSTAIAGPGYGNVACYSYQSCTTKKGVTTCTPGVVNLSAPTLGPGTYVFTTGVSISGTVKAGNGNTTTGKTATNGGATIAVSGTSSLNIDTASAFSIFAPADENATYNGVALYQSPGDTSPMQISFGSSSAVFNGMVYAPGAAVTLHDEGGGGLSATGMVVGTIFLNGKVSLTSYNAFNPVTTPFKVISLVE